MVDRISVDGAQAPRDGLNPGWLAALQLPRGNYVVYATSTFSRNDHGTGNGTARVFCELGGLDRVAKVMFFIHPPEMEPDPSVTVPLTVAGRGGLVYLKCDGNPDWRMYASDIVLTAVSVQELRRQ